MWRERQRWEKEELVALGLQGSGLVWVSAGDEHPERSDLERVTGRGKVKVGCYWVADLQEKAESCAELGDHVCPLQWAAEAHLVVHQLLALKGT